MCCCCKVCRRGQSERKAIASCKCIRLKSPKSPQFTREVFGRSRSSTRYVHWRFNGGLQALLKQVRPGHVHTWCYAHVLNLVIGDASTVFVQAVSLFELLNQMANFFKESYKNMNVWEKQMEDNIGHGKLRKLARFCQTRWSSRALALRKLFGSFNDDTKELFSDLVMVLQHVNETPNFKGSIRYEAKCLGENLSKFETVLVAFTYIRIFDITTPVSDYLQTPGLDVLQAWRMINEATDKLSNIARDFAAIYQHATTFINGVNDKLSEEGIRLTIDLPEIRVTRRAPRVQSAEKNFEINCDNVILISNRFSDHKELYNEIACFDPNRFKEVRTHPEMINLTTIAEALPEVDTVSLKEELLSFASNYHQLNKACYQEMITISATCQIMVMMTKTARVHQK